MYIIYSQNKTGEIVSRGLPFSRREEAILNLVKEAQNYLLMYKQVSTSTVTDNISGVIPHDGWVIERKDSKEDEISLYRGVQTPVKGWFSTYSQIVMERIMTFSIMSIPDVVAVHTEIPSFGVAETPKVTQPIIRHNEDMFAELVMAIKDRREKMG